MQAERSRLTYGSSTYGNKVDETSLKSTFAQWIDPEPVVLEEVWLVVEKVENVPVGEVGDSGGLAVWGGSSLYHDSRSSIGVLGLC